MFRHDAGKIKIREKGLNLPGMMRKRRGGVLTRGGKESIIFKIM